MLHDIKTVEIYYHEMKNLCDEYAALELTIGCICGAMKMRENNEGG